MTFLQFLLIFLVAPSALLIAAHGAAGASRLLGVAGVIAFVALVYAIPFDHVLMSRGIWDYGADKVQATAWDVPFEQYAFHALQAIFTAALTAIVLRRSWWRR